MKYEKFISQSKMAMGNHDPANPDQATHQELARIAAKLLHSTDLTDEQKEEVSERYRMHAFAQYPSVVHQHLKQNS